MTGHRLVQFAAVLAALLSIGSAFAFPDKPIQYIIPFAPGGESDIAARFQQVAFRKKYSQEMSVTPRPGRGG